MPSKNKASSLRPRDIGKRAWAALRKALTRNWPTKMMALGIAVVLWVGVVAQGKLVIQDVPVTIANASALLSRSLAIRENVSDLIKTTDVEIQVEQGDRGKPNQTNVTARVDLAQILSVGEQELHVSASSLFGNVEQSRPGSVQVHVEPLVTKAVPVKVELLGTLPAGFSAVGSAADNPSVNPQRITISGVASVVNQVVAARVRQDRNGLTSSINSSVDFDLVDASGNVVETYNNITPNEGWSVIMNYSVLPFEEKMVDDGIEGSTLGDVAEGFYIEEVSISPQNITVKAPRGVLDATHALSLRSRINVQGRNADFTEEALLEEIDGAYMGNDGKVNVTVHIKEMEETTTFDGLSVVLRGAALDAVHDYNEKATVSVQVTGPRSLVRALQAKDIQVYLNLTDYAQGYYEIPIAVDIPGKERFSAVIAAPSTMPMTIRKADTEER